MRFDKDESIPNGSIIEEVENPGGRKLATITNRDWALSEIYYFVKSKTQMPTEGEVVQNVEENFK